MYYSYGQGDFTGQMGGASARQQSQERTPMIYNSDPNNHFMADNYE